MKRREQQLNINELVLSCQKRRFDGGTEGELIRQIEERQRRQAIMAGHSPNAGRLTPPTGQSRLMLTPTNTTPVQELTATPLEKRSTPSKAVPHKRIRLAIDALIVGPLQIAVGSVGILTAALALATFAKAQNAPMAKQSRSILHECTWTLIKGLGETLLCPLTVTKALLLGKL